MSNYDNRPVVPVELAGKIDDHVLEVHERWQDLDIDDVRRRYSVGEATGPVVLGGSNDPEAGVRILALPHQQAWTDSMAIRAGFYHDVVNPEGVTVVLPNNGYGARYFQLDPDYIDAMRDGSMVPYYRHSVAQAEKALSAYGSGAKEVILDGYSLGGLVVFGMAAIDSDTLDVQAVNSYEAPTHETTPKGLQGDFLRSGGFGLQRNAVKDASIPALSHVHRPDRLIADYAKFFLATKFIPENKALNIAMASPDFLNTVEHASERFPEARFRIGYFTDSRLFDVQAIGYVTNPNMEVIAFGPGIGSYSHSTFDNVVANALGMYR